MKPGLVLTSFLLLLLAATPARADVYDDVSKLLRGGRLADAEARADQHLKSKPRDPQMRYFKGLIQRDTGRTEEALETFTRLTEDYPELPEPFNGLAVIHAARGDYEKARLALEGALRANPGYATAHENLGDLYTRMAHQAYCRALQYAPQNPDLKTKLQARGISCP